jgi:hypothetical protein
LEGIFDNIDFKGDISSNTNSKTQNTSNNEIRKNSGNSNKNINIENKSNNQEQPKKKMMIIKREDQNIKNAFEKEDETKMEENNCKKIFNYKYILI